MERALEYMGRSPTPLTDIRVDRVFIGSRTNSRIDLAPPRRSRGKRVASNVRQAMVVPGPGLVKQQAEREGLTRSSSRPASNGASPAVRCAWP